MIKIILEKSEIFIYSRNKKVQKNLKTQGKIPERFWHIGESK